MTTTTKKTTTKKATAKPKRATTIVTPADVAAAEELAAGEYDVMTDRLEHLGFGQGSTVKGKDLEGLNIGFLIKANQLKPKE